MNNFVVKAIPDKNQLQIKLHGFFMKSEIEYAIYLAKRESKKLMKGFDVLVSLKNLLEPNNQYETKLNIIKKLYGLEGSANVRFVGLHHSFIIRKINNVGLYPFKNE